MKSRRLGKFKRVKDATPSAELWETNQDLNIGVACGESDLCVLDFDNVQHIPEWLNQIKTYKVKTSRGLHIYFRGARKGTKLFVDGKHVGEVKSIAGYVIAEGSIHPSGAIYECADKSPIAPLVDISSLLVKPEQNKQWEPGQLIPHGQIHHWMVSVAGGLREKGLAPEEIEPILLRMVHENCQPPIDDSKVRQVARSMGNYQPGMVGTGVSLGGGETQTSNWRDNFRTVGELESGEPRMLVDGFLPEGTIFFGALAGEGKTFIALSLARALTTGKPFLGKFNVPGITPVLYLKPVSRNKNNEK